MSRIIIGLVGIAGSGKTLVAKRIERRGFERMRFAQGIKDMLRHSFGLSEDQVDGHLKGVPAEQLCGVSPRVAMQTLGTEWGRRMMHRDLWVEQWRRAVARTTGNIVVDDVRHFNEAQAVRDAGGVLWRIYRPGLAHMEHESERAQGQIEEDLLINNATTLEDLALSVDAALSRLLKV